MDEETWRSRQYAAALMLQDVYDVVTSSPELAVKLTESITKTLAVAAGLKLGAG